MEKKFVLRGVAAGALAGLVTFVFTRIFAEPVIARSIGYEDARRAAQEALDRGAGIPIPPEGGELFSRTIQENIGLAIGLIVLGMAFGALLAVVFTLVQRGSGRHIRPRTLALLLAGAAFVGVYLVPFLKYPANPPAASDAATITARGGLYLLMQVLSVVGLTLAVQLGRVLSRKRGTWQASLLAGGGYVAAMTVAMLLLRGIHETPGPLRRADGTIVLGGFNASDLYDFRLYTLAAQLLLWGVIGLVLGAWAEKALKDSGYPVMGREPSLV